MKIVCCSSVLVMRRENLPATRLLSTFRPFWLRRTVLQLLRRCEFAHFLASKHVGWPNVDWFACCFSTYYISRQLAYCTCFSISVFTIRFNAFDLPASFRCILHTNLLCIHKYSDAIATTELHHPPWEIEKTTIYYVHGTILMHICTRHIFKYSTRNA